ncbi:MAG: ATP-binding protein [Syntrophobacteraceae bacterium]|nr:ATP-binding protein [Syntrophobacteraceae bacterium]
MKWFPQLGLRHRSVMIVLLAGIPTLTLLLYSGMELRRHAVLHARQVALHYARDLARTHERIVNNTHQVLSTLSQLPPIQGLDPVMCNKVFKALLKESHVYTALLASRPDGTVYSSAPAITGPLNVAHEGWFRHGVETRHFAMGRYEIGKISGKAAMVLAQPVFDDTGELKAVVAAGIDLDWLRQTLARTQLPQGTTFSVTDSTGAVLARFPNNEKYAGKSIDELPIFRRMSNLREGIAEGKGIDGVQRIYGFVPLIHAPRLVQVRVGIPMTVAFAKANRSLIFSIVLFVIIIMLTLALAWIGAGHFVVRPIVNLSKFAACVSDRNLSIRCGPAYTSGELGVLERAFDLMAESLEHREAERKRADDLSQIKGRALSLLSRCNKVVVRAVNEPELLHVVCRQIIEVGGYRFAWVGFAEDDEDKTIRPVAHCGYEDGYLETIKVNWAEAESETNRSAGAIAIRTGEPVVSQNILSDPKFTAWREEAAKRGYASSIALPMRDDQGRSFGVLRIYAGEPDAFGSEEINLLEELAEDLAYGIRTLRMRDQRNRAEKALLEQEHYYRSLIFNMHDDIMVVDKSFVIKDINKDIMGTTGLRREDMIGRHCFDVAHGADEPCSKRGDACQLQEVFKTGIPQICRHEHNTQDGSKVWVDILFSALKDDSGEITHVIEASRDVTKEVELRQQFRQAQKMEAIGTLAGGIAHDFNNIIGIIQGYSELLTLDMPEDSDGNLYVQNILTAGLRAKELVKQILAFSRKGEQERLPLRLSVMIQESLKLLRAALPSTIEIRQDLSTARRVDILADATQIHQVLMNLCTNAAHAMGENGGVLTVSLSEAEFSAVDLNHIPDTSPGRYVCLEVGDTGHGMDRATIERIFEPYFTTKGLGEGTGLGLAVVHGIVKSHDGAITVESEPGKGTSFRVFFPVVESIGAPGTKSDSEYTQIPRGKEHILLVDDEARLANAVQLMLERLGYRVSLCRDGMHALDVFSSHPESYDLVITDQTMPHMTGFQLARKLIEIRPRIPILLCTGFCDSSTQERAKALGIRNVLMKPLSIQQMAETIRRAL